MKNPAIYLLILPLIISSCNPSTTENQKKNNAIHIENMDSLSGAFLFEQKCMICHIKTKTSPHMKTLNSPPMTGIAYHLKKVFTDSISGEINRQSAFNHVFNYVFNPDISISICDSSRISEYGMMPSLKGSVTQEELEKITNYFLDNFLMKEYKTEDKNLNQL